MSGSNANHPGEDVGKQYLLQVRNVLQGLPVDADLSPDWRELLADLAAIRKFAQQLSKGDLSGELAVKGRLAGNLKALQASLRHLTWQVQQVAQGDLSQEVEFMGEFSAAFHEMSAGLSRVRAEEQEQRVLAEALRDTAAALNSALGLDEVIDIIMANIGRVVPHDTLDIFLVDERRRARVVRCTGYDTVSPGLKEAVMALELEVDQTPNLKKMAESAKPLLLDDLTAYNWLHLIDDSWARSYLGAPILVDGDVVGFLSLMSTRTGFFNAEQAERLMAFANQTAVALQKVRLIERLNLLATTDGLTELANRRHFMERAEYEFERAHRYFEPIAALMVDIDHFKRINDTYGHATGDVVLYRVARVCADVLRKIDLVGRYGGEEFAVLLPEISIDDAARAAQRLCQAISGQSFLVNGHVLRVTASVGVAETYSEDSSVTHLIDRADRAMYRAKQRGRNQVVVFE